MKTPTRSLLLPVLLLLSAARGVGAQADTIAPRPFFRWRDAAILGGFATAAVVSAPLDRSFASRLQNPTVQDNRAMRGTARTVETITDPGALLIGAGLYTFGIATKNVKAADLGLHGTEALFIGAQLGSLLKGVVGRARPYMNVQDPHDVRAMRGFGGGGDYRAFPSGHSIAAFSAAAVVTSETKRWWPRSFWVVAPLMYGGAATVAWSRMYDNKHWASDVVAGAAIGTFTGLKVVQWHHTHPGNWVDRLLLRPAVIHAPNGETLLGVQFQPPF